MTPVFADTFYFLAILNVKNAAHQIAVQFSSTQDAPLVTTAWVLTEVADGLSRSSRRKEFRLVDEIVNDADNTIIPPTQMPSFAKRCSRRIMVRRN